MFKRLRIILAIYRDRPTVIQNFSFNFCKITRIMNRNLSIGKTVITKALAGKPVKGIVYFLHGACDNGVGLQSWVDKTIDGKFAFRNFPVVYPSSPKLSYSLHEGKKEYVWFDQLALNPNFPEDYGTISAVGNQFNQLMKDCKSQTEVPSKRVIIGGFSMGGAMALHLGYTFKPNIAGVFALSSFLPPDSRLYDNMDLKLAMNMPEIRFGESGEAQNVYEEAVRQAKYPKLFMSHGLHDPIVPLQWAKQTFNSLRKRGVDGHFYTIENTKHSVSKQQLGLLHDWIDDMLSDKDE